MVVCLFPGCDDKKVLPENIASQVYVNIIILQETYSNSDTLNYYKEQLFQKYQVSKDDYNHTLESFSNDAEKWESFFNKAEAYLDSLKKLKVSEKPSI